MALSTPLNFDILYEKICNKLREKELAVPICEKMKKLETDLDRIDYLLEQQDISFLPYFSTNVKIHYKPKCLKKSEEFYLEALQCSSEPKTLQLLNSSFYYLPYELKAMELQNSTSEFLVWLEKCCDYYEPVENTCEKEEIRLHNKILWQRSVILRNMDKNEPALKCLLQIVNMWTKILSKSVIPEKHEVIFQIALIFQDSKLCHFLVTKLLKTALKLLRQSECTNEIKCKAAMKISVQMKRLNSCDVRNENCSDDSHTCKLFIPIQTTEIPQHKLFGQRNSKLDSSSDAIELKYSETKGRHAVATKDIPIGIIYENLNVLILNVC